MHRDSKRRKRLSFRVSFVSEADANTSVKKIEASWHDFLNDPVVSSSMKKVSELPQQTTDVLLRQSVFVLSFTQTVLETLPNQRQQ